MQLRRAFVERRTDGAAVRIATPLAKNEPVEKAQKRIVAAARRLYPELVKVLPE